MGISTGKVANATVAITWQSGDKEPKVSPDPAAISTQGQVTWQVGLPSGHTVKIDFAVKGGVKGPFPLSGQPDNPSTGVFEGPAGNITSAASNAADGSDWKYSVAIYKGTTQVAFVDPMIIIRDH